jgi:hypothetical protein
LIILFSAFLTFQGPQVTQPIDPAADSWYQQFLCLQKDRACLQKEHTSLQNQLSIALQLISNQSVEIQTLKDEVARLKGTSPRPKLPPNRLEGPGSGSGKANGKDTTRGKHQRKNKKGLSFNNEQRLKPDNLPEGAIFKGTRKYDVQDIVCQAYNTRYIIERWQLPDGTYSDHNG